MRHREAKVNRLIFGCGYLGTRVGRLWGSQRDRVNVVTRSDERAIELGTEGFITCGGDVTEPGSLTFLNVLPELDTVLHAVGYDRGGEHSIHQVYAEGMQNVLAALPDSVGRFIYISTTGVYGDAGGEWIDEQTPPNPSRAGGQASLAAEQAIRESRFANKAIILRLAGIYGPGRLPYLKQIEAGEPIEAPQTGHLNLIHVDDAARIVHQVACSDFELTGPRVYCVCDGNPVVRSDYYSELARLLGAPEPRFATPADGSPRAARAAADKRVSNRRLLEEVQPEWLYSTYREGLAAILSESRPDESP